MNITLVLCFKHKTLYYIPNKQEKQAKKNKDRLRFLFSLFDMSES